MVWAPTRQGTPHEPVALSGVHSNRKRRIAAIPVTRADIRASGRVDRQREMLMRKLINHKLVGLLTSTALAIATPGAVSPSFAAVFHGGGGFHGGGFHGGGG